MLSRWVSSRDRETATKGAEVTRSGRLFQTRAAATGKARSLTVRSRVRLTINDQDELERSRWRASTSAAWQSSSVRYAGADPCRHLYTRTDCLSAIRSRAFSQWRLVACPVDCNLWPTSQQWGHQGGSRSETLVHTLRLTCMPMRCRRWHFGYIIMLSLQKPSASRILRHNVSDSSRRSQHEGAARSGSWRRQAPWWCDVAALELHMRCNNHRAVPTATECHHRGSSAADAAADGNSSSLCLNPRLFPQWLWELLAPRVLVVWTFWLKSEGVWLTRNRFLFQHMSVAVNIRHARNLRVLIVTFLYLSRPFLNISAVGNLVFWALKIKQNIYAVSSHATLTQLSLSIKCNF